MPNSFFEKLKTELPQEAKVKMRTSSSSPTESRAERGTKVKEPAGHAYRQAGHAYRQAGQLAVDIYQTEEYLVIQSAIAGVKQKDLEIAIKNDLITIKGNRPNPVEEEGADYFTKECYWGPFLKDVIAPVKIDSNSAKITFEEGILTIRIPKK